MLLFALFSQRPRPSQIAFGLSHHCILRETKHFDTFLRSPTFTIGLLEIFLSFWWMSAGPSLLSHQAARGRAPYPRTIYWRPGPLFTPIPFFQSIIILIGLVRAALEWCFVAFLSLPYPLDLGIQRRVKSKLERSFSIGSNNFHIKMVFWVGIWSQGGPNLVSRW